ncbi:hypothetical protein EVG20_g3385 [Dentipellis fragilis]|uniref:DUF7770 domain-containing protein n=1 Tax=Dentipellis fragilis TaxID=205917 RepID=A0A4Y9Z453_9AGAM|nr:hypothetical protein EVG20_g3385 [Dentipellis fragilis]
MSSESSTVYTKQFNPTDDGRAVSQIIVNASGNISTAQDLPDIWHWRLHLLLSPDPQDSDRNPNSTPTRIESRSVVLDMIPAASSTGTMCITSKPTTELHSPNSAELAFAPIPDITITVRRIVDLFLSKGMDRYTYNDRYTGCVLWVRTGIEHLQDAGWVERGAVERLDAFYREQTALQPRNLEEPFGRGVFYGRWYVSVVSHPIASLTFISTLACLQNYIPSSLDASPQSGGAVVAGS